MAIGASEASVPAAARPVPIAACEGCSDRPRCTCRPRAAAACGTPACGGCRVAVRDPPLTCHHPLARHSPHLSTPAGKRNALHHVPACVIICLRHLENQALFVSAGSPPRSRNGTLTRRSIIFRVTEAGERVHWQYALLSHSRPPW